MHSIALKGLVLALTIIFTAVSTALNLPPAEIPATIEYLTEPETVGTASPTTVNILQRFEEASFAIQQVCELYSEENPDNAKFFIKTVADSGYEAALRAALLAGEGVDLFQIKGARELVAFRDNIIPINLTWASSAVAGVADAVTIDGQVYALPYSIEGFGLILNRNIFEAAEIELPPAGMPSLLSELRTPELLGEKFAELREAILADELKDSFPFLESVAAFPAYDDDFLSGGFLDILSSGAFASVGDAIASPASLSFPAAEATEELIKLLARHSVSEPGWSELANTNPINQIERLAEERVAVILADTDIYKRVNEINPALQGRLRLLPIPLNMYEQPSVYISAKGYWAINAACEAKTATATRDFLTWLYRSPSGTEALAEILGALSPYRETAKTTGAALHAHLLSCIESGLYLPRLSNAFDPVWKKDTFSPAVRSYFTDFEKTWEESLGDAGISK